MRKYFFLILIGGLIMSLVACDQVENSAKTPEAQVTDSVSYYSQLILSDSTNYRLFARRAALYLEKENVNAAFRDLSHALELNDKDASLYIMLSKIYFIIGKTESSITSLKKAIDLNPKLMEAYLELAELYLILREYDLSAQYAEIAKSIDVNNAQPYYFLGIGHMEQGDTAKAILQLQLAANLDSLHYPAMMQLGLIYSQIGDSSCQNYYRNALKAKPQDEGALYYLANSLQNYGHYDEALVHFESLSTLYPTSRRSYYHKGYIYLVEFQDYLKAENEFIKAIDVDPTYVEAVYNLGRTYEAMGKYELATVQYRQALKLLPNYPLAIQGINRIDDMR